MTRAPTAAPATTAAFEMPPLKPEAVVDAISSEAALPSSRPAISGLTFATSSSTAVPSDSMLLLADLDPQRGDVSLRRLAGCFVYASRTAQPGDVALLV